VGRCLNIGEIGTVTLGLDWTEFGEGLAETNVTHLYISEGLVGDAKDSLTRTLRSNRLRDRRHLYEHDVIDATTRLWHTPKSSTLYQTVFKHLSYADAKRLANDKATLKQLYKTNYAPRRNATWNVQEDDGYPRFCCNVLYCVATSYIVLQHVVNVLQVSQVLQCLLGWR
jgi:hypothetical protein